MHFFIISPLAFRAENNPDDDMLNYFSVIHLQVVIAPSKNIGKIIHELDVVLFDLSTERFRQFDYFWVLLSPNIAIFDILVVHGDLGISSHIVFIKQLFQRH
jgi:hypothetical protein